MERKILKAYMRLMKDDEVVLYSDGYLFTDEDEDYFESLMTCNLLIGSYDEDDDKIISEFLMHDFDNDYNYIMLFESYDVLHFDYSDTFTFENSIDPSIKMTLTTELEVETGLSDEYLEKKLIIAKTYFDIPC